MTLSRSKEFYLETRSGDSILIEIFEENGNISFIFDSRRYDLRLDSAFDLADALLMVANDAQIYNEK